MLNISFPCQLTTKLRKGTLEEGSGTANETTLKCAVNFNSLEFFYLPKLGGSRCLSGSRYNRPRSTFISRYTHLQSQVGHNNFRTFFIATHDCCDFFFALLNTGNTAEVERFSFLLMCYVRQLCGVKCLFFCVTGLICDIYSPWKKVCKLFWFPSWSQIWRIFNDSYLITTAVSFLLAPYKSLNRKSYTFHLWKIPIYLFSRKVNFVKVIE